MKNPLIVKLNIDKILYKDGKIPGTVKLERRIVKALLELLKKNGWKVESIDDGDEIKKCNSVKSAMELIFNLDEAHLHVKNGDLSAWIFLVGGNGVDVISDFTTNLSPILNNFDTFQFE
jgi:hypothetical protein